MVPTGAPTSLTEISRPASIAIRVAASSPARRVVSVIRDTLAIDGSASPRNPMLAMPHRSSTSRSFDVAWRSSASTRLAALIPQPSSVTRTSARPPPATSIAMVVGAGVDRVVDQLLDHRRRPLDHLARRDLIDHVRRPARAIIGSTTRIASTPL